MNGYFDPQLLFYAVVFLATVLALEGGFLYWRDIQAPKQRMSKRMQMLTAGASNGAGRDSRTRAPVIARATVGV